MVQNSSEIIIQQLTDFENDFKNDLLSTGITGKELKAKYVKKIYFLKEQIKQEQFNVVKENYEDGERNAREEIGIKSDDVAISDKQVLDECEKEISEMQQKYNEIFNLILQRITELSATKDVKIKTSDKSILRETLENTFSEFNEKGFNIVTYKDEKNVNFVNYSKILLAQAERESYQKSHASFREECGVELVKINDTNSKCDLCAKHENNIYFDDVYVNANKNSPDYNKYEKLSSGLNDGLFHFGCKHKLLAYVKLDYSNGVPLNLSSGQPLTSENIDNYKKELFEYFKENVYNKDERYGDKLFIRCFEKISEDNKVSSKSSTELLREMINPNVNPVDLIMSYFDVQIKKGIGNTADIIANDSILNTFSKKLSFEQWLNDTYPRTESDVIIDNLLAIDRRKDSDYSIVSLITEMALSLAGADVVYDIADMSEALERGDKKDALINLAFALPIVGMAKGVTKSLKIKKISNFAKNTKIISESTEFIQSIGKSRKLRRNMIKAGVEIPDYLYATHHIVAGNNKKADVARSILTKFEIDVNDEVNGVFLRTTDAVSIGMKHNNLHSKIYYNEINEMLNDVKSKEDLINLLDKIRKQLLEGTFVK